MRSLAIAVMTVLLAGCGSSTDIIDDRVLDCAQTNEVMVRLGLDAPGVALERVEDHMKIQVEVSNNTAHDIVVKWIRVEQTSLETAQYLLDSSYRAFDQVIAEADDHTFELPTTGRALPVNSSRVGRSGDVMLAVSVGLGNGDTYRCSFDVNRR